MPLIASDCLPLKLVGQRRTFGEMVPALGAPNLVAISRHGSIGISWLILEGASTSYGGAVAGANYAVELGSMAGSVKASFSKGQV